MSTKKHRLGVSEVNLVVRYLKLEPVDPARLHAAMAEVDELYILFTCSQFDQYRRESAAWCSKISGLPAIKPCSDEEQGAAIGIQTHVDLEHFPLAVDQNNALGGWHIGLSDIVTFKNTGKGAFGEFAAPVHALAAMACHGLEEPLAPLLPELLPVSGGDRYRAWDAAIEHFEVFRAQAPFL